MYNADVGLEGFTVNDWVLIVCVIGGLILLIVAWLLGFGGGCRNT